MKNLILLIAVLFTFSCKKNDDTTTPSGTTNPTITTKNPPEVSSVDKFNLKTGLVLEIEGKNFSTNPT